MNIVASTAAVFAAGLTLLGTNGSVIELMSGRRLTLGDPFVVRHRLAWSLALTAAAGPFMLINDALDALRERRIGVAWFALCMVFSMFWVFAAGIVATALATKAAALLT